MRIDRELIVLTLCFSVAVIVVIISKLCDDCDVITKLIIIGLGETWIIIGLLAAIFIGLERKIKEPSK